MDQGRGLRGGLQGGNGAVAELGVGIVGMRERVRQLGGELEIEGHEGGTVVRAVLPVPVAAAVPATRQVEHVLDAAV
jgi:signal transduction histidine kinase